MNLEPGVSGGEWNLPEGFRLLQDPPGRWWIVRADTPITADQRAWDGWIRGDVGTDLDVRGGRAPARLIPLAAGSGVLRHYRRGGWAGPLWGDRFWGVRRFVSELQASEAIRGAGIPTPEILGLHVRRAAGPWFRAWIVTRHVPGGLNLREWLATGFRDLRERSRVLRLTAHAVSSLHAAGCRHRDLNLSNLLLVGDAVQVLDLDGARIQAPLDLASRGENLLRLYRSLAKETSDPEPLSLVERRLFLRTYAQGNAELFRLAWRDLSRRWAGARFRRRLALALRHYRVGTAGPASAGRR